MGLTKRRDGWYVEFPVVDDGKTLTLARGTPGARIKRWKTGASNKTVAKQQEALIKTDLMKELVKSERVQGPMTFRRDLQPVSTCRLAGGNWLKVTPNFVLGTQVPAAEAATLARTLLNIVQAFPDATSDEAA